MSRGLIKTGIGSALHWVGADRLLALRAKIRKVPLVIGYHRVVDDFHAAAAHSIPPMLVSVRMFERHLDWIGRHYRFITLDELAAWTEGDVRFDRPVAAITFDDGYADVYRNAVPVLRRKGIPAAVFVVTDRVGTPDLQIYDELYLLLSAAFSRWTEPRRYLGEILLDLEIPVPVLRRIDNVAHDSLHATWALVEHLTRHDMTRVAEAFRAEIEIPEVVKEELLTMNWEMLRTLPHADITVGSHTRTHARLILENWKRVVDETQGSREDLECRLEMPIRHFAYPSGAFNTSVVSAVAAAGYRCAFTSCQHRDDRYPALTIPRRLWWENSCLNVFGRFSPAVISCQARGAFDIIPSCRQAHGF